MERFCDELRVEREQRKVSIETICAVTKVSKRYLQALEAGDYDELPGGVFRKGILRSYLGVLGLEEAPWLERFEASLALSGEKTATTAAEWAQFAENVRRTRAQSRALTGKRWLGVAGMFALLALFGWLVWTLVGHRRLETVQPTANVGTVQTPATTTGAAGAGNPR